MIVSIDVNSSIPLYEQLKNQIISGILNRVIIDGEQLPSVRQLSGDLDINMHTVSKVYKILENEGFILINKKKGAFINVDRSKLKLTYEKEQLLKEIKMKLMLYQNVYMDLNEVKEWIDEVEVRDE